MQGGGVPQLRQAKSRALWPHNIHVIHLISMDKIDRRGGLVQKLPEFVFIEIFAIYPKRKYKWETN